MSYFHPPSERRDSLPPRGKSAPPITPPSLESTSPPDTFPESMSSRREGGWEKGTTGPKTDRSGCSVPSSWDFREPVRLTSLTPVGPSFEKRGGVRLVHSCSSQGSPSGPVSRRRLLGVEVDLKEPLLRPPPTLRPYPPVSADLSLSTPRPRRATSFLSGPVTRRGQNYSNKGKMSFRLTPNFPIFYTGQLPINTTYLICGP